MITRFKENLLSLIPETAKRKVSILVGVSSGVDSMCMANLFLKMNLDLDIAVAHVNFSLRGAASDGDQAFVEKWCADNGVKCYVKRFDTRAEASSKGVSIEMAARELRYEWFNELMDREHFEYVAVAHNMNDNVETLFLNIVRGTGLSGIKGMKPLFGRILRPMLIFSRADIESFCKLNNIAFREDATNADVAYHRNRVRNNIFPELKAINPSFLETISRDISYFGAADAIIEDMTPSKIAQLTLFEDEVLNISIPLLKKEKYAAYWLFKILQQYGFNSSQVEQISLALDSQSGKQFLSDTHKLIRDRSMLKVYPLLTTGVKKCNITIVDKPKGFNPTLSETGVIYVDADKVLAVSGASTLNDLLDNIKCRNWQLSDKFKPLGMKGFKLISDFFNDLKIDIEQKSKEVIVTVLSNQFDETIIAVAGRRIDDRFKVSDSTASLLRISLE